MFSKNVFVQWRSLWVVRGQLSRRGYLLFAMAGMLLPFTAWWWLSDSGLMDKVFMPGPMDVVTRLYTWFTEDHLASDIWISTCRVVAGFAISALFALPLGIMIGSYRPVQALLEPLTDFIRYMPAVAFIPLVMLWVGVDESSKIAIIFIGTFFK
jgi:NitT/TauT family transport system permease protein